MEPYYKIGDEVSVYSHALQKYVDGKIVNVFRDYVCCASLDGGGHTHDVVYDVQHFDGKISHGHLSVRKRESATTFGG